VTNTFIKILILERIFFERFVDLEIFKAVLEHPRIVNIVERQKDWCWFIEWVVDLELTDLARTCCGG
jgi:hypothetical protein